MFLVWVVGGWSLAACSKEEVLRTIVRELARHSDQVNDKINKLRTQLTSLQQQLRHYKLAASLANQRQRDESWWERKFATETDRNGDGFSASDDNDAAPRRPERRRLLASSFQQHNCTRRSPPLEAMMDVEGTCACTNHMIAAGMNVTGARRAS